MTELSVVPLHPKQDREDIVKALRNIADDIEKGEYDFTPTIGLVILGQESSRVVKDGTVDHYQWSSHGIGKGSWFAYQGLLACALNEKDRIDDG